jgi:hypothetical protein
MATNGTGAAISITLGQTCRGSHNISTINEHDKFDKRAVSGCFITSVSLHCRHAEQLLGLLLKGEPGRNS